jgi:hypothetical protein
MLLDLERLGSSRHADREQAITWKAARSKLRSDCQDDS